MKEKILKLRSEGKSYNEIKKKLGCSKSTISYHCGDGQKEKNKTRHRKHRFKNRLANKLTVFKNKKRKLKVASRDFQRRLGGKLLCKSKEYNFNYKDVLKKFGEETVCYLSGEKINLIEDSHYALDHKISASRGGDNSLDNLGILHKKVNDMKYDLTIEEFLFWCEKILRYNGYEVNKIK